MSRESFTVELDGYVPVDVVAATKAAARYAAFRKLKESALDHPASSDAATWRANMPFKEFCQRSKVW